MSSEAPAGLFSELPAELALQPIGERGYLSLCIAIGLGPAVMWLVLLNRSPVPAPVRIVFFAVAGVCGLMFMLLLFAMQRRNARIEHSVLTVRTTFYSMRIALPAIDAMRTVVQRSAADQRGMRVNGIGLPGLRSGWFAWRGGGRILVDCAGSGDYLLLSVNGRPQLALAFADNAAAAQLLRPNAARGGQRLSRGQPRQQ